MRDTTQHSQRENGLLTPVIWSILVTECGERFAYYGFRAILVLYFTMELEYDENDAIALFAYTTAFAYLSPLFGAILADGSLGRYNTILVFGAIYVIGLVLLTGAALFGGTKQSQRGWTILGLLLVCLGTGGIKPCVSSFGADQVGGTTTNNKLQQQQSTDIPNEIQRNGLLEQYNDGAGEDVTDGNNDMNRDEKVRAFFAYFYFCINVGALSSVAVVPIIRGHFGFGAAFLVTTLFMITAMGLFFSMRRSYVHHVPGQDGSSLATTFTLCWWLIKQNICSQIPSRVIRFFPWLRPGPRPFLQRGSHVVIPARDHDSNDGRHDNDGNGFSGRQGCDLMEQQLDDARQAIHLLPLMSLLPVFWCLYDQQSSVWTLQATRMELNGLQPEQLNVLNPLQIMMFIPLFDRCIYPWMEARRFNIRPLRRMSYGMVLAAAAFFVSGWVESVIQNRAATNSTKINVFWQLPQITLLSLAEILVSVTGLEFAYATSPDRLKAFIMALFLLTTSVGDFLSGTLYSTVFADLNRALIMHICGFLMLGNLVLFSRVARWWEAQKVAKQRDSDANSVDGVEFRELEVL